jgi:ATP-dependent DNA helicase RecQ
MCDNCAHPKNTFPAKEALLLLFDTLLAMKGKYKMAQVLDVIQGRRNNHTETYRHTDLPQFGKGNAHPDTYWLAVMRQALVLDFLSKEVEHYGTLLLSKKALDFIDSPFPIELFEERNFHASDSDDPSALAAKGGSALDTPLLAMLKDLRKQIARQRNLPPFVIFQDFSLDEMATAYPINMEELKHISGVGEGKAMKFGKPFAELISNYVDDNDIDRPMDLGFKSVANKSAIKVAIIQSIDRKIPLDVIARNKDLELAELIQELETIVQAGIRLDLDYYVNKLTEEEEMNGIFELLRDSEDADIQILIDEFGDVYSEEELRVLRVKFLSDMGN